MFEWFIEKYSKTTTKDCKANWQWMAAKWHPANGFKPLMTHLFISASYARVAQYPMRERNVIDIGLHVIKRCGMYSKQYKNWIVRESKSLPIVKTINSFKEYWSAVCDGVLLDCGVMVLVCPWFPPSGVVGTFAPLVTSSFMRSVMSFCSWLAKNFGDIF
jgi:hypothetical protein